MPIDGAVADEKNEPRRELSTKGPNLPKDIKLPKGIFLTPRPPLVSSSLSRKQTTWRARRVFGFYFFFFCYNPLHHPPPTYSLYTRIYHFLFFHWSTKTRFIVLYREILSHPGDVPRPAVSIVSDFTPFPPKIIHLPLYLHRQLPVTKLQGKHLYTYIYIYILKVACETCGGEVVIIFIIQWRLLQSYNSGLYRIDVGT